MVTEAEIERVAKLMKIEIAGDEYADHIDRVQKMIEYFDVLDRAGTTDAELSVYEMPVTELREDEHVTFAGDIQKHLKNRKNGYVRAPKMV